MGTPHIHVQHKQFPGIPAKALAYFHPRNGIQDGVTLKARTVADFAFELAGSSSDSKMPKFHRLNLILQRMADLNLLMVVNRGGIDSMDASYFCPLTDEEIAGVCEGLDGAVYGFPVIYEERSPAVLPIVHFNDLGRASVGSSFLRTQNVLLTAKHCLAGASRLSIRGITADQFKASTIVMHKNDAMDLAAIHFGQPVLPEVKPIPIGIGNVLDEVMVLGYPNVPGFTELLAAEKALISARLTATQGAIASEATEIFAKVPLFLITARVRGGFSGGPVLISSGAAVGLVSRQPFADFGGGSDLYAQYDNLGYGVAIPSEVILEFLTACSTGNREITETVDPADIEYTPL